MAKCRLQTTMCLTSESFYPHRKGKQSQLQEIIDAIIVKSEKVNDEKLNYYQGHHDVVSTMLITLDQNLAY